MTSESESDVGLGLNEYHQKNLCDYMRFIRYVKVQNIRTIDSCFQDAKNSKLIEDTYTLDEVKEMIDEILSIIKIDIESEWLNLTHTNALLLKQLFSQAEKWHLKLHVDTSQLENNDLLLQMKEFEERQMTRNQKDRSAHESPTKFHLEPLNDSGSSALLQHEIETLQKENAKLRERLKTIEFQASTLLSDRSKLSGDLRQIKIELQSSTADHDQRFDSEVSSLTEQLSQAKDHLEKLEQSLSKKDDLEQHLTNVTHQLLQVQAQLEKKEKDLETKINQTTAFVNLKKMLHQKNQLLKSLRNKLEKYEPSDKQESENDED